MRILIADDEALVRYGLKSVLNDELDETPLILEAENGKELIRKVTETRPHIGFVDIRMPKMNGLEAISVARKIAPDVLWVVLTGHADFAYAQEALKLGVEDFLIKPADPVEVKALMKRLVSKAREQQISGHQELEAKVSAVLGETTSPKYDPYFQKPRFWQAALIVWDSLLPDTEEARCRRDFAVRIRTILENEDDFSGTVVSMRNGNLLLVFSVPAGRIPMDQVIDIWNRRFRSYRSDTSDISGDNIGDTWFLTRVVQDAEELFREVEILEMDACLRFLHKPGHLLDFAEITRQRTMKKYAPVAELLDDLGKTWRFGQEGDFHGLVHLLVSKIGNLDGEKFISGGPAWYARYVIPLPGRSPGSLNELIRELGEKGHILFADRKTSGNHETSPGTLVERAEDIMARRYRETIGVAQIAEELGVSANYLSTVFKKETGRSLTRQITELRLEKALALLDRPGAGIADVARSLGYQSSRHFTRLFKDRYDKTPSEWMQDRRN